MAIESERFTLQMLEQQIMEMQQEIALYDQQNIAAENEIRSMVQDLTALSGVSLNDSIDFECDSVGGDPARS